MSRKPFIAGNWKMNTSPAEAAALLGDLKRMLAPIRKCQVMVATPYVYLQGFSKSLEGTSIELGAQEVFYEDKGAFTGAIAAPMLKGIGCEHVLIGHSERRQFFGETLETSAKRMQAALRSGLKPMLCIGESLEEREADTTFEVIGAQLEAAVAGLDAEAWKSITIAYEPVWAIGTGKVASPKQAQDVHAHIRERLHTHGAAIASDTRILYGGSVKPSNAEEILAQPDIDGALVGGASLDADSFAAIARACP